MVYTDAMRKPSFLFRSVPISLVALALACASLVAVQIAWAEPPTIEVVKGTTKGKVHADEGRVASGQPAAAQDLPRVEVFLTDWCPYCQKLEAFLNANQIPYERKNIEQEASFRSEHAELGGGGIPVTRIGGSQVVRGFRPVEIARALGIEPR